MAQNQERSFADGPLTGIRVIDLSQVISGPLGTAILADQGAEVITIEPIAAPDVVRRSGPLAPPTATVQSGSANPNGSDMSAMYAAQNRNKRNVALNLKAAEGKEILLDLVRTADVVVQNFRPGALERLGLGWEVFRAAKPDLIMCSVSGFGTDGPYSHRPAFDPIIQSVASYPSIQLDDQGRPNLMATALCDKTTSLHVAQSICAALVARANGAGGQHIELAMVDVAVHFLYPEAMWNYIYRDHEISDMPDLSAIYSLFQTADGWVMVYPVATVAHWKGMCRAFGRDDLATDPRFDDLQGRVRHGKAVNEELQAEIIRYTTVEVVAMMDDADVPVAPVNTRPGLGIDPHIQHRELLVETDHPVVGRITVPRPPARFSATPSTLRRHAPSLGEHTDEVLAEVLGRSPEDIALLHKCGVVA